MVSQHASLWTLRFLILVVERMQSLWAAAAVMLIMCYCLRCDCLEHCCCFQWRSRGEDESHPSLHKVPVAALIVRPVNPCLLFLFTSLFLLLETIEMNCDPSSSMMHISALSLLSLCCNMLCVLLSLGVQIIKQKYESKSDQIWQCTCCKKQTLWFRAISCS